MVSKDKEKLSKIEVGFEGSGLGLKRDFLQKEFAMEYLYYKDPSRSISRKIIEPLIAKLGN